MTENYFAIVAYLIPYLYLSSGIDVENLNRAGFVLQEYSLPTWLDNILKVNN